MNIEKPPWKGLSSLVIAFIAFLFLAVSTVQAYETITSIKHILPSADLTDFEASRIAMQINKYQSEGDYPKEVHHKIVAAIAVIFGAELEKVLLDTPEQERTVLKDFIIQFLIRAEMGSVFTPFREERFQNIERLSNGKIKRLPQ